MGAATIEEQLKQRQNNNHNLSNDFAGLTVIELPDNCNDHNSVAHDSTIKINTNTQSKSGTRGSIKHDNNNQDPLAVHFLLTAALWGRDEDHQPHWTSVETAAVSTSLLASLQQKLSSPVSSSSSSSLSSFDGLLRVVLEDKIQPVVSAYSCYNTRTNQLTRYKGPGVEERVRAAHQLTWLTRHLGSTNPNTRNKSALTRHVPTILPLLLACLNDVSPEIQSAGLWGLEHCANNHLNDNNFIISSLRPSRKVDVLDAVRQGVVGCDEVVWPAGAAALVALAIHVEGTTNPITSIRLVQVVDTMLYEAELHQTKPKRALIWLRYFPKMFPTLSFLLVRYFARLMPLLIEWISDNRSCCISGSGNSGTAVQEAAVQCLTEALRWTWPRSNIHIPVLWPIIEKVYNSSDIDRGVVEAAKRCGVVMYAIADDSFKDELKGKLVDDVSQELASSRQML